MGKSFDIQSAMIVTASGERYAVPQAGSTAHLITPAANDNPLIFSASNLPSFTVTFTGSTQISPVRVWRDGKWIIELWQADYLMWLLLRQYELLW